MLRFATVCLCAGLCLAQTPAGSPPAGNPPAGVDEALRARVTEFYQDFVDGKYRQAEALIGEDSKDTYYNGQKAKYHKFELKSIEYSDNFTHANVVTMCETDVPFIGFAGHVITIPVTSSWKLENGNWFWHYDEEIAGRSPFGVSKPDKGQSNAALPAAIPTDPGFALGKVKPDKPGLTLKAEELGEVTFTNSASGPMTINLAGRLPNVDAKLDRTNLQSGEKAVLTIQAHAGARGGVLNLQVEPTDERITLHIKIDE